MREAQRILASVTGVYSRLYV
ncbi:hypothetical protein CGLO_17613 [Colletotrichum gloeosporioides Cg-14]|uniref:Uncharacterized protein n=1 Tax=Colletotrichum gloeosporioides (strain Cg-14) TaxID=1237896 RepID=T0L5Z2_COLGC|nr:hypothetical protein CGLO_17613 [Colletotrichum gloeosporioides Cg-14]